MTESTQSKKKECFLFCNKPFARKRVFYDTIMTPKQIFYNALNHENATSIFFL